MTKKEKKLLKRILVAGVIFIIILPLHFRESIYNITNLTLFKLPILDYIELPVYLICYFIIGWDILYRAIRNIRKGQVFDENFLMATATIGAFLLDEYAEGVAVMLFYQVGELFQSCAVSRSRHSISDLMDIRPDYANVMRDGQLIQVDPEEVAIDDVIMVKPGERIPLDGTVTGGSSALDTSALTGESAPRDVFEGDEVISGCINQTGVLTVKVNKEFAQSTVSKILEMVESASDKKSRSENFITRFARVYTPFVVFSALALAIIPPFITGQPFSVWVSRALTFLVISCPCALVISVPLSFFGGIGGASKSGVLVKGSSYLELLSKAEIAVFDKTGTLTKGNFTVGEIQTKSMGKNELIEYAAYAEDYSLHPIAASIKKEYGQVIDASRIKEVEEIAGHGVRAVIDEKEILAGNSKLMKLKGIEFEETQGTGTTVYIASDSKYAGSITITDELKPDAYQAIQDLKAVGIKQTVMLTGDSDPVGKKVSAMLNLDKTYTELLPADKVEKLETLMAEKSEKGALVFVGDGINDAPVLARADIGIAMGALGSQAAIEAADIVIMTDEPSKIATVMRISKKTLRIVRQNIVFALLTKGVFLILGAMGLTNMWGAVFADVGVSVLAILNAIRTLNAPKSPP